MTCSICRFKFCWLCNAHFTPSHLAQHQNRPVIKPKIKRVIALIIALVITFYLLIQIQSFKFLVDWTIRSFFDLVKLIVVWIWNLIKWNFLWLGFSLGDVLLFNFSAFSAILSILSFYLPTLMKYIYFGAAILSWIIVYYYECGRTMVKIGLLEVSLYIVAFALNHLIFGEKKRKTKTKRKLRALRLHKYL